jgi:hypothetical protein
MNKSNIIQILIVSMLSIILLVTPTVAQNNSVPGFPMLLNGAVEVNGQAVPAGTTVSVFDAVTNKKLGEITTLKEGLYGDLTNLVVNEPSDSLVRFNIQTPTMSQPAEASQTIDWESDTLQLDLTATYVEGSSNGGSGGSSSSGVATSTDTVNDDTSAAGGSGGDAGDIVQDTSLSPDSDGLTDPKDKSPFTTIVIAIIIVIAALGALLYIRSKNL